MLIQSQFTPVVSILIFLSFHICQGLKWKSCSENDEIELQELKVTPEVISLSAPFTITGVIDIKNNLSGPLHVTTEMKKSSGVLQGTAIPCVGRFGTCKFTDACVEFKELCPLKAGRQTVRGYTTKLPEMSSFVRWMAEGDYQGKITISDREGREIGCVTLTLEVTS